VFSTWTKGLQNFLDFLFLHVSLDVNWHIVNRLGRKKRNFDCAFYFSTAGNNLMHLLSITIVINLLITGVLVTSFRFFHCLSICQFFRRVRKI
jgi:hypothetical protein